jgi:hypothetical protein
MDAPAAIGRQADRNPWQFESACHVPGQRIDRTGGFRRQQHVACEIEEAGDLVAAGNGF